MITIHPSEPKLETLKEIRTKLYTAESTAENLKKIKAIEVQIARHEQFEKENAPKAEKK